MRRSRRRWIMDEYRNEIEMYCIKSGLSIEKVFSAGKSENYERVILQYCDPVAAENSFVYKDGKKYYVIGGPPCPIMLAIYLEDGKLRFEQTEHTYRLYENETALEAALA